MVVVRVIAILLAAVALHPPSLGQAGSTIYFTERTTTPLPDSAVPAEVDGSDVILLRDPGLFDCRAPDGQLGRCGVFRDCESLRRALLPITPAAVKFLKRSVCRFVSGTPMICCPRGPPRLTATTPAPLVFVDRRRTTRRPPRTTRRPPSPAAATTGTTSTPAEEPAPPKHPTPFKETVPVKEPAPEQARVTTTEQPTTAGKETPPTEAPTPVQSETAKPHQPPKTTSRPASTAKPTSTVSSETAEPASTQATTQVPSTDATPTAEATKPAPSATTPAGTATTVTDSAGVNFTTARPEEEEKDEGAGIVASTTPPVTTPAALEVTTVAALPTAGTVGESGATAATTGAPRQEERTVRLPGIPTCGYRNTTAQRIVGGRISEPNAWPWLATLGYELKEGTIDYLCGGALITERHVLTAAHCVKPQLKTVRFGEHDLARVTEVDTVTEHEVQEMFPHAEYNNRTLFNDIAIIKLRTPVPFSDAVHPACLPLLAAEMRNVSLVGRTGFIAGWGTTKFRGEASDVLKEATIKVHRQPLCKARYRPLRHKLNEDQMCASSRGNDACQGDSGGPLMFPSLTTDNWYVMGVVSFGFRCGEPRFPGIYTRVTSFMAWVEATLR